MEVMEQENQYNQREANAIKRKPVPKPNGPLFTIPRLKKIKRDLLTELPLDTHECQQEILAAIRKSFHFPLSTMCHFFNRVQSVHNPDLTAKYLEKRRDMKSNGYPDALLADTFAFLPLDSPSLVDKICRDGVRCGNQQFSGLGVSHMAVHLCKHADILTPMKPKYGDRLLLMVKLLKGKVKTVICKNVGVQLEPTPNYDCHIAKANVDQSTQQPPHMLFYSSQLYVYEYGDFKIEDYPRQVLPYAVVYYTVREPQLPIPKNIVSLPHAAQITQIPTHKGMTQSTLSAVPSSVSDPGPSNEVWRGRLHVQLVEGGNIFIEVSMLSYFVPLTVNLISPIKIHGLYPEHNAQFTFFCGLSNIAHRDEVEWRAHYFRSCIMRPRLNNEEHFKALVKHISVKREMPTVRLPHDVFLFLMPNCLLASQLGLVRRDDDSPLLHCVIMSKYSTSQAQEKQLMERGIVLNNYGSATSWEDLFDDSDSSDDEADYIEHEKNRRHLRRSVPRLFHDQRHIHNKFAAMSLADAEVNFASCACKKISAAQVEQQRCRDAGVARVFSAVQSANLSSQARNSSCFPSGSRQKSKQKLSSRVKSMPSFSPHGSDTETDADAKGSSRGGHDQYSLLNSTKTVEEELSEEELTNEQMEDIIFLRKPVSSSVLSKPLPHSASTSHIKKPSKQPPLDAAAHSLKLSASVNDLKKYSKPPLSSKPVIIPTEPLKPSIKKAIPKPKVIPVEPKLIPSEPVNCVSEVKDRTIRDDSPGSSGTAHPLPVQGDVTPVNCASKSDGKPVNSVSNSDVKPVNSAPKIPKSILKVRTAPVSIPADSVSSNVQPYTPSVSIGLVPSNSQLYTPSVPTGSVPSNSQLYTPSVPTGSVPSHSQPFTPSVTTGSVPSNSEQCTPSVSTGSVSSKSQPYTPSVSPTLSVTPVVDHEENDFGDVDMRVPHQHSTSLHPVFLAATDPSFLSPLKEPLHQQQSQHSLSPNLSFGSWLAPGEIQQTPPLQQQPAYFKLPATPPSPPSPPTESPPSPTYSPASPPADSPASPPCSPPLIDSESPASPPQSLYPDPFRSSPVAIPTSRVQRNASPEFTFAYTDPFAPQKINKKSNSREGIDNADDMKDFLNSGFDSDSSYEDER